MEISPEIGEEKGEAQEPLLLEDDFPDEDAATSSPVLDELLDNIDVKHEKTTLYQAHAETADDDEETSPPYAANGFYSGKAGSFSEDDDSLDESVSDTLDSEQNEPSIERFVLNLMMSGAMYEYEEAPDYVFEFLEEALQRLLRSEIQAYLKFRAGYVAA